MTPTQKENNYFNRELSWISFNERVLSEARDPSLPVLERLKFIAIVSSNFDEFFMVRVATIKRHERQADHVHCPSGIRPSLLLKEIRNKTAAIVHQQYRCFNEDIIGGLEKEGIIYLNHLSYTRKQSRFVRDLFRNDIFHTLTPIRIDEEEDFPFTSNLRRYILFELTDQDRKKHYAMLQVPPAHKRVYWLPTDEDQGYFTFIQDIILHNGSEFFPGYNIEDYISFRVTRDADLSVDEEKDEDYVDAMAQVLEERKRSLPIRLQVSGNNKELMDFVAGKHSLKDEDIYHVDGPVGLASFMGLAMDTGFDHLRNEPWEPVASPAIPEDEPLWDVIRHQDILLHHPYESFDPVIRLVRDAAGDPDVLAIKITLYRTSGNSPVVRALQRAAQNGKQVTAVVELKARFDEERNIEWAEKLEQAGAIVVYGIAHLKVHAKVLLIVRREPEGIKRYLHLGTGNYNDKTAQLYTDIGLLSSDETLTFDASLFFNTITGYSSGTVLSKLVMAPAALKEKLLSLINRETQRSSPENPGNITAKMNSLADTDIIDALYRASRGGVRIRLNIRGVCMLIPGVPGLSENITVVSIIGRYLEHSRILYLYNGGSEELYLSSADWMPRNLERRVELMFPVSDTTCRKKLKGILKQYFLDNVKAHVLESDGSYSKLTPGKEGQSLHCQDFFHQQALGAGKKKEASPGKEFIVRRTMPE